MKQWTPRVLRYGRDEALPERRPLRAGPLSLVYEEAELRYIRLGGREVLRRVYVAVRNRTWGTVLPALSDLRMDVREDSFRVSFEAEHKQGEIDFAWQGAITGSADGTIEFSMDGVARSTFVSNRIGICVLHPVRECAGRPCTVEHVDGSITEGGFPHFISPHPPFTDMRAIAHEASGGVLAEVRFEGAVFEMEDQRNWTDESYKTYSPPLRLPSPVEVKQRTRISQSVALSLRGRPVRPATTEPELSFTLGDSVQASVPRIGLAAASHGQPLEGEQLSRLRMLNLSHLRVDLKLYEPDCESVLRQAWREAEELGVGLEAAVFVSDAAEDELQVLRELAGGLRPVVHTWLIFHRGEPCTSRQWVESARRHLAPYDPAARIGAGTNVYFAELNRARLAVEALDLVSFSMNAQVHAFDNASLVEALQGQSWTIESARRFIGDVPLAISPITLRPRFSPAAVVSEALPDGELPPQVDERQMSLFGAGWTAGSLKHVFEGGVYSATYYETTGWRGVMETPAGSPLPDRFRSLPGCVFPVFHVFADVGEFAGAGAVSTISSDPLVLDGLAVRNDGRTRIILANFTAERRCVAVHNVSGRARIRRLDETNAEVAMMRPEQFMGQAGESAKAANGSLTLELLPYAVVRMDMPEGR